MSLTNKLGWIPDLPDQRDHIYAAPNLMIPTLPPSVDLRPSCPPVYDQGQLGSCTANAISAAIEFEQMKQGAKYFMPARLFIYYNERDMENTVPLDNGAAIRDGVKSVNKLGVCKEDEWPYDIAKFTVKPPDNCYKDASQNLVTSYQRVNQSLLQMKACLAEGYPFVFGFTVYESIGSEDVAKNGHLPMPQPSEKVEGGHAVLAVGYDDANQWFIIRNSWGDGWGMKGYFTMPYAYLTDDNLANDLWTIRLVNVDDQK